MAITFINYIKREDGSYIDFEQLSPEEKKKVSDKITTRLMESMGYKKVAGKGAKDEIKTEAT